MHILSEKIAPPPRRKQILDEYPDEGAAPKKREEEDRWIKQFIDGLNGVFRRIGK
jgi:hypothetical protein